MQRTAEASTRELREHTSIAPAFAALDPASSESRAEPPAEAEAEPAPAPAPVPAPRC
jgi:hypothetical protein